MTDRLVHATGEHTRPYRDWFTSLRQISHTVYSGLRMHKVHGDPHWEVDVGPDAIRHVRHEIKRLHLQDYFTIVSGAHRAWPDFVRAGHP
ncbi:MAG: hypothetical protein WAN48_03655 [Actinomycetes bacterium]